MKSGINFSLLQSSIEGDLHTGSLMKALYATDASVYQELPDAVLIPKSKGDIIEAVKFATKNNIPIIPRSAGTSLAGQCVGNGIVIDISKHLNKILDFDPKEKTIWVEPGVIRDELNHFLAPHGLFFGPNTSTANRCMMAGMVGNNSCGSTSIKHGATRDHLLALEVILADGSEATIEAQNAKALFKKSNVDSLESNIYKGMLELLSDSDTRAQIIENFPYPEIKRRNTGYALDYLINSSLYDEKKENYNLCKILAGSEGTLAFTTKIKLSLSGLPGPHRAVICPHFNSIHEAMLAVPIIMKYAPDMCELMDKIILDCTKANKKQAQNRFFLDGDPKAILMVQFNRQTKSELEKIVTSFTETLTKETNAYSLPVVNAPDDLKVFELRAAGLGVLANIPGEAKAVACIEDTAVRIDDLAEYISEFEEMMEAYGQEAVFYAHAGAGEIHLRPILDLKKQKDVDLFKEITLSTAKLVKKYKGSLSGEHGDGRVRAEFIPLMVGNEVYELFKNVKSIWDPNNIFNPGKIVNAKSMNSYLRYEPEKTIPEPETMFRWPETGGIIRTAEKCNGSGDCRKLDLSGGTMCPSYKATRNEKDSTRARANALRYFLSHPVNKELPFQSEEIKDVLDLCLSCKACGTECPSNVDMTTLKAEFTHQYQKINGSSLRSKVFANINGINKISSIFYPISKWTLNSKWSSSIIKKILNIAPERSFPVAEKISLRKYYQKNYIPPNKIRKSIYLFCDEFTNYNDVEVGKSVLNLLTYLAYNVKLIEHPESGRAAFSKGFLTLAKKSAENNVSIFSPLISADCPLIGIEPSAILSFRDEYPKLVSKPMIESAAKLSKLVFTFEEFLHQEIEEGNINADLFDDKHRTIAVHGHCHQKALSDITKTCQILSLPKNHEVDLIPSGCCGMAGAFGYEKEHYEVSMKVGNSVLFPYIEKSGEETIIAAAGTSCRHQIKDGVNAESFHPAQILWDSLKK